MTRGRWGIPSGGGGGGGVESAVCIGVEDEGKEREGERE